MSEDCPNCLSVTACTTDSLHLSVLFHFNEQLLDDTPCHVKIGNENIGTVRQLETVTILLHQQTDFTSIYIQCQLCESTYFFNHYLPSEQNNYGIKYQLL